MNLSVRELIEQRFIEPTRAERPSCIGIEIEMPVVSLKGERTDKQVSTAAFVKAAKHFSFTLTKRDADGFYHEAVCEETGDVFSFDCSYNNFEISLGKVRTLHEAWARFKDYVGYINSQLREQDHLLTGMGIHPYHELNDTDFVASPRYQMLEGYLKKSAVWQREGGFHPYCSYPTYSSASQVQLDVSEDKLCEVIEAFSWVEPVKGLLFANSYLPEEPQLLCARDMLWERSTHGINPKNLNFFEPLPHTTGEMIDYLSGVSVFCAERDGKYLFFYPIPFEEYLSRDTVEGEYFDGMRYVPYRFQPQPGDIAYLRSYKQIDLTARGTLEFRSACTQPLSQAMTVAAFHLGLMGQTEHLIKLLKNDRVLYRYGNTPSELRALCNRRELPDDIDRSALRDLLLSVLLTAQKGLSDRGYAEECYLEPLFQRADTLTSPAKTMLTLLDRGANLQSVVEQYAGL